MSDLLAQKKARLEKLKQDALNKKKKRENIKTSTGSSSGTQGGGTEDINALMDNVFNSSSAFEERKKQEEDASQPSVPKQINTSMTVALDQCQHSIAPSLLEFLDQEIQCEKGKKTLNAKDESSDESGSERATEASVDVVRRNTVNRQNVNGIPMVTEFPGAPAPKDKSDEKDAEQAKEDAKRVMSKEEAEHVAESAEFKNFFTRASRLVERGLFSDIDVIGSFERLEVEEGDVGTTKDKKITEKAIFMKDNPVKRAITNLEWSPKHKELFLCSYAKSENDWDPNETDGLIHIFSTQMPSTPELILTCQSEVTSAIFHPTEPYLVIGGTFSGNVIVWDMREKRNYPIVKTPTSDCIMISGIDVVGTQNANNIITVNNRGSICVWSLNMMKEPQKKVDLQIKNQELSVRCIDFPEGETNQFYVGSEDSNIYDIKIHTKNQNDSNIGDCYSGHKASILSIHHHPVISDRKSEASGLLLSTSADWGLGVWHPKSRKDPLLMVEGEVEIYDAQWSPVHPSVFATCNGYGQIDIWDIAKETEECRHRIDVDIGASKRAISKIRWSQDGKRLLSGNSNGTIKLWNVDKEFYQYREEDLVKLEKMLMPTMSAGMR